MPSLDPHPDPEAAGAEGRKHWRPLSVQDRIRKLWSAPMKIDRFLSDDELTFLKELQQRSEPKTQRPYATYSPHRWDSELCPWMYDRLVRIIGECKVTGGNFFQARGAFAIHADTGQERLAVVYKAVLIPLFTRPEDRRTATIFFKQRWLGKAATFVAAMEDPAKPFYNDNITDYSGIEFYRKGQPFDRAVYEKHFRRFPYQTLSGLELDCVIEWTYGSAIIFDRCQLHCSDGFRQHGIEIKSALSLFTEVA